MFGRRRLGCILKLPKLKGGISRTLLKFRLPSATRFKCVESFAESKPDGSPWTDGFTHDLFLWTGVQFRMDRPTEGPGWNDVRPNSTPDCRQSLPHRFSPSRMGTEASAHVVSTALPELSICRNINSDLLDFENCTRQRTK